MTGPPGSNVIGIWLARGARGPGSWLAWKDGGEHAAREERERGTGEGDGGRAFSTAPGTALALVKALAGRL